MTDITERIVDNKLLTVLTRVVMLVVGVCLPFILSFLIGVASDISKMDTRMSVIETRWTAEQASAVSASSRMNSDINELRTAISSLQAQNTQILATVSRLDERSNLQPYNP